VELGLIVAVVLVAANAFFVGAEFAIARLRPTQAAQYVRERRPGAKSAQHAVEHIDAYLSACQLGITVASLGLGAVGEPAFHDLLEPVFGDEARIIGFGVASAVAFAIITVAHVVLGELAPKSAAIARTGPVVLALAPPMRAFYLVTKPIVDLFNGMGNLVLKPFGIPPASEAGHAPHSEDELRELLRESREGGMIHEQERQLSEAALVFGDLRAREVMQPRPGIDFVTTDDSTDDVIETAMRTGRTRLPLVEREGDLDHAVGVVNAKDLLPAALGKTIDLRELARPLPRVAEGTRVDAVLRDMRRRQRHLALVVDEHGTVTGLLTLEDVLEELVGEIDDEFDTAAEELIERDGGEVRIDGSAPVRLVARELGLTLDAPHEATVSGHLIEHLGRVPRAGETVELDGARLEVLDADATQIARLAVRGAPPPPLDDER
jgi:CBS domain containing-hemolysin-like protein